jgi:PiT family inorganic phosphate transporter
MLFQQADEHTRRSVAHSAMAGVVGGGGLGDLAIRYGYQRFESDVLFATVVLLIAGVQAIQVGGLLKILISLFASPIIGFVFGFVVLKIIFILCWEATPRINNFFKKSQLFTALALGLSHGSNDGQKTMGIITLALVTGGYLKSFVVPFWVVAICAGALTFGTAVGGWLLIRKPGNSFYKIRPVDGFSTQITSAITVIIASIVGGPVSATQVINTAIMGVGAAERANKVRWGIAKDIVSAWILTIPATALVAAGIYRLVIYYLP